MHSIVKNMEAQLAESSDNFLPFPDDADGSVVSGNTFLYDHDEKTRELISGIKKEWIEYRIRMNILRIIVTHFQNPIKIVKIIKSLNTLRRSVLGESRIKKIACVNGKYYWDLYTPGWPSKAFDHFFEGEISRIALINRPCNRFTNVMMAITKKCSLKCEHCFEWDALNGKEKFTLRDIKNIVHKFQKKGTGQIQLTGGEPMLRFNDIVEILKAAKPETDFWILTSGHQVTIRNAQQLKQAGLTGVIISLDHFEPSMHNQFRGHKNSFAWVQEAVKNSISANLIAALSICVTKSFVNEANLFAYASLAKKLGVSFVQIVEPQAVGHYQGKNVVLEKEHEFILEKFYLKMNYDSAYRHYPIITYHGYHQRRTGCFAAANRNIYIDTEGDMHACPFCRIKTGSALSDDMDRSIQRILSKGCHNYASFNN